MEYKNQELFKNPPSEMRKRWLDFRHIVDTSKTYNEIDHRRQEYLINSGYLSGKADAHFETLNPFYSEGLHIKNDYDTTIIYNHCIAEFMQENHDAKLIEDFVKVSKKGEANFNKYFNSLDPTTGHIEKLHNLFMNEYKQTLYTFAFYSRDLQTFVNDRAFKNGMLTAYIQYEKTHLELFLSVINNIYDNVDAPAKPPIEKHVNIFKNNGFELWEMLIDSFGLMQGVNHPAIVNFIYDRMQYDYIHSDTIHKAAFYRWINDVYSENHPEVEALQNTSYKAEQYSKTYQLTLEKFKNLPEKGK